MTPAVGAIKRRENDHGAANRSVPMSLRGRRAGVKIGGGRVCAGRPVWGARRIAYFPVSPHAPWRGRRAAGENGRGRRWPVAGWRLPGGDPYFPVSPHVLARTPRRRENRPRGGSARAGQCGVPAGLPIFRSGSPQEALGCDSEADHHAGTRNREPSAGCRCSGAVVVRSSLSCSAPHPGPPPPQRSTLRAR